MKPLISAALLLCCMPLSAARNIQPELSALSMACARSSLFIKGPYSAAGNPSLATRELKPVLGFSANQLYSLRALQFNSLYAVMPLKPLAFSGWFCISGNRVWQQTVCGINVSAQAGKQLSFSTGITRQGLRIPAYGSSGLYALNLSLTYRINSKLKTAFTCKNLISRYTHAALKPEPELRWGICYQAEKHLEICAETELYGSVLNLIPSLQYHRDSSLTFCAGINGLRRESAFGIRFRKYHLDFTLGTLFSLYTGFSSAISLAYAFRN